MNHTVSSMNTLFHPHAIRQNMPPQMHHHTQDTPPHSQDAPSRASAAPCCPSGNMQNSFSDETPHLPLNRKLSLMNYSFLYCK